MINIVMEISLHDLYLYDDIRRLLLVNDQFTCSSTDNAPMNKRPLKLHKGLDNTLRFRVFNPDRQPTNVCQYKIYGRLFNTENREMVLEKLCRTTTAKGMVFLDIDEGDIANIAVGLYDLVIVGQQPLVAQQVVGEKVTTPFYTDTVNNIVATVLITGQAERVPIRSHVVTEDDWTPTSMLDNTTGRVVRQFYSSSIPGNRVQNHINGTHSFSVYTDEENKCTGYLTVLGTLDLNPTEDPHSTHWFKLQMVTGADELEFVQFFGTEAYSFSANVMFLKFLYTPAIEFNTGGAMAYNQGFLKKIILRS
jgi:hypothetical protein